MPVAWTEILRISQKQYRQIKMCANIPFFYTCLLSSKTLTKYVCICKSWQDFFKFLFFLLWLRSFFFYYSTIINTLLLGSIEKSGEINARNYYSKKVKWYDMALVKFGEKISQENFSSMWGKKLLFILYLVCD